MTTQEIMQLRGKKRELLERGKALLDHANVDEHRPLRGAEVEEFDNGTHMLHEINAQLKDHDESRDLVDLEAALMKRALTPMPTVVGGHDQPMGYKGPEGADANSKFLTRSQKVADVIGGHEQLSIGRYLRGIVTNRWDAGSEAERRIAQEGQGSTGGYLVPSGLSSIFVDTARAQSVATAAGMVTYIMTDPQEVIARQVSDFTVSFVPEGAAIPPSDLGFDAIYLKPVFAASLCKVSIQLLSDARNIESILTNAFTKSMGQAMDAAALTGNGINAPRGLTHTPGVNLVDAGGALTGYGAFSLASQEIQQANGQANAVLLSPASYGELDRLVETTTGQPLRGPDSWNKLEKFVSTIIPDDLAIVGQFNQLLLAIGLGESGQRGGIRIEVSRESSFNTLEVELRCTVRLDVAVLRPPWFTIVQEIA